MALYCKVLPIIFYNNNYIMPQMLPIELHVYKTWNILLKVNVDIERTNSCKISLSLWYSTQELSNIIMVIAQ